MSRANDDEWGEVALKVVKPKWKTNLLKEIAQLTHYGIPKIGLAIRLSDLEEIIRHAK